MNKLFSILLFSVILLCFISLNCYSQNDSLIKKKPDTLRQVIPEKEMAKSPTGALLRSVVLPGWGQYYVESYWKAPIFVAGWGTLIFFIYDNNSKFKSAETEYANYTGTDASEKNFLYRKREYFRDYRDLNILYLTGVYLISAIDAYVGANLFEFNVDDNLTFDYRLNRIGTPEVGLQIKF